MATGAYIGSDTNKASKLKKIYIGIENKARRVKKAYIGVSNLARLWLTAALTLRRHPVAPSLSVARSQLASAPVSTMAVFAGGKLLSGAADASVDVFNFSTMAMTSWTNLLQARFGLAGCSFQSNAVFGGGQTDASDNKSKSAYVESYTYAGTKTTRTSLIAPIAYLAAAAIPSYYALFLGGEAYIRTNLGGGTIIESISTVNYAQAYNTSFTRSTATSMSYTRRDMVAVGFASMVVVAYGTHVQLETYSSSLTHTASSVQSTGYADKAAGAVVGAALYLGGGYQSSSTQLALVARYTSSLTKSNCTNLTIGRSSLAAATANYKYAVFAGGGTGSGTTASNVVDAYLEAGTKFTVSAADYLRAARLGLAGVTAGSYAVFAAGETNAAPQSAIDIYFEGTAD